jgi:hypothetical protein
MFGITMIAGLCLAASPALAKEPCALHMSKAKQAVAKAINIVEEYNSIPVDNDQKNIIKRNNLKKAMRETRNDYQRARSDYNSAPPCGSGELNDDIGMAFPEMI